MSPWKPEGCAIPAGQRCRCPRDQSGDALLCEGVLELPLTLTLVAETENSAALRLQEDLLSAGLPGDGRPHARPADRLLHHGIRGLDVAWEEMGSDSSANVTAERQETLLVLTNSQGQG